MEHVYVSYKKYDINVWTDNNKVQQVVVSSNEKFVCIERTEHGSARNTNDHTMIRIAKTLFSVEKLPVTKDIILDICKDIDDIFGLLFGAENE